MGEGQVQLWTIRRKDECALAVGPLASSPRRGACRFAGDFATIPSN